MLPSQPNQALVDGLAVLQALAVSERPTGSREMGRMLGIEATRVNRLLRTLAHLGMARQTADRKYLPGPAMHVLSAQSLFGSGLVRSAMEPLARLNVYNLTVAMGVLWRDQVCYLYHATPGMSGADALGRVGLYPASRSGIGLSILASQTDEAIRDLYRGRPVDGFENVDALLVSLRETRERGWAYAMADEKTQTVSLGVAVGSPAYASVAFSGPITPEGTPLYVDTLQEAADAIERAATGGKDLANEPKRRRR
ncbi:MAG: helix-turn-helix domain-containing protein [Capsulimonadaceae bacterium]|nr:helix-turn-helix domain-containing protein [Capsulimonadaceae bacterium]